MPSYIIKVDTSRDEYVYWSTVVEGPVFYGGALSMEAYLRANGEEGDGQRLERADEHGTSAMWGMPLVYSWADDEGLIFDQRGTVYRDDLWALASRLDRGEDVSDLIQPFDDDEDAS